VADNFLDACRAANEVLDAGHAPLTPQFFMSLEAGRPRPYEEWMRACFALLTKADAVWRIGGESPGADRECVEADRLGIPWRRDLAPLLGANP